MLSNPLAVVGGFMMGASVGALLRGLVHLSHCRGYTPRAKVS